ncbi:MAG: 2,3-bisphosphoglycerate-independent phosphoglycerate mutase [Patescibacteria group bacterium]|nr:2,3-bisphosphoglycerate-independent phosphoglycerate mutase [Patescibacteria group bacterium]
MRKTFVLAILDGWGIGKLNESNPIHIAGLKTIRYIENSFPSGALQASGIAVGLPWGEEGNSEVGHLTIGTGRTLYQHFPRISMAIEDGSFFKNPALRSAFLHARKNNSAVHLIGLLTKGNVHASLKHLVALIEMAKKENCPNLYLHLFADGLDSPPHSLLYLVKNLEGILQKNKVGVITSLMGRYYAMNRDNHWERTEKAYRTLTGIDTNVKSYKEATEEIYQKDLDDEFIEPIIIDKPHPIQDNDAVIFFNFREDSMRQITESFANPAFNKFPIKKLSNLSVTTMTEYQKGLKTAVAFPSEKIKNSLGEVLADNQKTQLRIAETKKYAHVTYFFNGLRDAPFPNEYRVLIPSKSTIRQEEHPEMMAGAVTERLLIALNEGGFDFILINYANPDIIAHTGNYQAVLEAVKVIDKELEKLIKSVLAGNHVLLITSDHGNAESVLNLKTGEPETTHDPNPVPIYLVAKDLEKSPPANSGQTPPRLKTIGILSDVAPTILDLMNIPKPSSMTGQSLLDQLV